MLKGEIEILSSIALNRCKMKQLINGRIIRDNLYVTATVDSMVKEGFIRENKSREYCLTLKGMLVLLEFGNNHEIFRKISLSKLLYQSVG